MCNDDSSNIPFYFGGFLTPTQKSLVQVGLLQFGHTSFEHVLYLLLSQVIMNLTLYEKKHVFSRVYLPVKNDTPNQSQSQFWIPAHNIIGTDIY